MLGSWVPPASPCLRAYPPPPPPPPAPSQVRSDLDTLLLPLLELLYSAPQRTPNQARMARMGPRGAAAAPPVWGRRPPGCPAGMAGHTPAPRVWTSTRRYTPHPRTQMYMLLIILLMLSQDAAFAQNIHRIALPVGRAGGGRAVQQGLGGGPAPAPEQRRQRPARRRLLHEPNAHRCAALAPSPASPSRCPSTASGPPPPPWARCWWCCCCGA